MTVPVPLTDAERLAQAQDALHKLKLGRLSIEVTVDGRTVRYQRTDIDKLEGYVDGLLAKIANRSPIYGAIGFYL